jgi:hypothetical protein
MFTNCAVRSVYVPLAQNVLLFDEKKQIQLDGYIGSNTTQLQMAYNPIKHVSVSLNTSYGAGLTMYEGALGFYGSFKKSNHWRYEILGGGGFTNNFSQVDNAWFSIFKKNNYNYETIALYNKYYIQPAIGFFGKIEMYKLTYSLSLSCKTSLIDFKKYIYREIDEDATAQSSSTVYAINREYYHRNLFLFEPCLTNKVGLKNVSAVIQAQVMMPYSTEIDIRNTKFSPVFLFSLGLQYNFVFKNKNQVK